MSSKELKAVATLVAGTIGVGFLALPYAMHSFGTFWGILILIVAAIIVLVTNLAYTDIIITDRKNCQIPTYTKLHLGTIPSYIVTFIIIFGLFGILLAYSMIAGTVLSTLLSPLSVSLSVSFLGTLFILVGIFVMKSGMKVIAHFSTYAVIALIAALLFITISSIPHVTESNISSLHISELSTIFGIALFALYSTASIPMVDEIIGYESKKYHRVVILAVLSVLVLYIIFGVVMSLRFGDSIESGFIDTFTSEPYYILATVGIVILLSIFTSFVLVSNNIREILSYDYKVPNKIALLLILALSLWIFLLNTQSFESLLAIVGNFSLAVQSLVIFAIWFRMFGKKKTFYKIIVALSGCILIIGIVSQF